MDLKKLIVKSFGPIENADIEFGDLTLLVGPQASGKSIFLQLLKLLIDKNHIRKTLKSYSYSFEKNNDYDKFLDIYFGKGMSNIWAEKSEIVLNGEKKTKAFLAEETLKKKQDSQDLTKLLGGLKFRNKEAKEKIVSLIKENYELSEQLFYIPAQRILSVSDGRPKNFTEFDSTTPYVIRLFSENLRDLLGNEMNRSNAIFPVEKRLKKIQREFIDEAIFHGGKIILKEDNNQKKLQMNIADMNIPFMTWSAGQKEFMPLLMGFYYLSPGGNSPKRKEYKYAVIEEPEMGLHPRAIQTVILQIVELLSRNYKVIVSTHSSIMLEFAWAFQQIKKSALTEAKKDKAFCELFDLESRNNGFFKELKQKCTRSYFFRIEKGKTRTKEISSLDAGDDSKDIAEWGGISEFASRATDTVSKIANDYGS